MRKVRSSKRVCPVAGLLAAAVLGIGGALTWGGAGVSGGSSSAMGQLQRIILMSTSGATLSEATLSLRLTPTPPVASSAVLAIVTVTGTAGPVTGTVVFGKTFAGCGTQPLVSGTTLCQLAQAPSHGWLGLKATYLGSATYGPISYVDYQALTADPGTFPTTTVPTTTTTTTTTTTIPPSTTTTTIPHTGSHPTTGIGGGGVGGHTTPTTTTRPPEPTTTTEPAPTTTAPPASTTTTTAVPPTTTQPTVPGATTAHTGIPLVTLGAIGGLLVIAGALGLLLARQRR